MCFREKERVGENFRLAEDLLDDIKRDGEVRAVSLHRCQDSVYAVFRDNLRIKAGCQQRVRI